MSILDEPKIDCHNHVFDPARFPYVPNNIYSPPGAELGTPSLMVHVFDCYNVRHALIVGPNSGYDLNNDCLLDTITANAGRFKGIASVHNDITCGELERLKAAGIAGCALNPALWGVDYYADAEPLLAHLADLGMFAQVQVQGDQLLALLPLLERTTARILIDHCGRPVPEAGVQQPGFQALLELGRTGRATIKLSGHVKWSRETYPYRDTRPYVDALIDAFTPDRCVWGSDWPFLRTPERIDFGTVLKLLEAQLPNAGDRRKVLWDTPHRLFW